MKKVLVTGGSGFIGSHFIDLLLSQDSYYVINLDFNTYASTEYSDLTYKSYHNYKKIVCNIANYDDLADKIESLDLDYIVNFAAETHVDNSIDSPERFMTTNIIGTFNILHHISRSDKLKNKLKKFVQVSTDEVYGHLGLDGEFKETDILNPRSPYSASKASSDLISLAFNKTFSIPLVITRCANNFGIRQNSEKLIPKVITLAMKDKPIPIYGNGDNVREWISAADHCAAIKKLMESDTKDLIYNIGSGYRITNYELVVKILDRMNKSRELIEFVTDRPGHDFRYALNINRLITEFDWRPSSKINNEELDELIDYYTGYSR